MRRSTLLVSSLLALAITPAAQAAGTVTGQLGIQLVITDGCTVGNGNAGGTFGTIDFGKFLDDLDVSTNMAGYMSSKRGCVVLDENQKVTYVWTGMPDQLPDVTEIQAALGIGKTDFA